jgi:hypothetical protein
MTTIRQQMIGVYLDSTTPDPECRRLLRLAMTRALDRDPDEVRVNEHQNRSPTIWVSGYGQEKTEHVRDWIVADVGRDADWIGRTNRDGVPLKLAKIGSIDRAVKEADKAMRRFANSVGSIVVLDEDEEVHMELADGWRMVRLLTPAALDRESTGMGHCIGGGSYDEALDEEDRVFLSLRDPKNIPHATLEIENGIVLQCQGKANKDILVKHRDRMKELLRGLVSDNRISARTGFITDNLGVQHHVDELPDELEIGGSIELVLSKNARLPSKSLIVGRKLVVRADDPDRVVTMPKFVMAGEVHFHGRSDFPERSELAVSGDVVMKDCAVVRMADRIRCSKLDLSGATVGKAWGDAIVSGRIDLRNASIPSIPDDTKCRDYGLAGSKIGRLPAGVEVSYDLVLHTDLLEEFPKNFTAKKDLQLVGADPVVLDASLKVHGRLEIKGGHPDTVVAEGSVYPGAFEIVDGGPSVLPDGMKVEGSVLLNRANLEKLPDRFEVGGNLVMLETRIASVGGSIPGRLEIVGGEASAIEAGTVVGRALYLRHTKVEHLPDGLRVGGGMMVEGKVPIRSMGTGIRVVSGLEIGNCAFRQLPRIEVGGDLVLFPYDRNSLKSMAPGTCIDGRFIPPSSMTELGENLTVGCLDLLEVRTLERLPRGLRIEGDLIMPFSDMETLPDDIVVEGNAFLPQHMEGQPLPAGIDRTKAFYAGLEPEAEIQESDHWDEHPGLPLRY